MKKYLAIYIGTVSALETSEWNKMDEGKRKQQEQLGSVKLPVLAPRLKLSDLS